MNIFRNHSHIEIFVNDRIICLSEKQMKNSEFDLHYKFTKNKELNILLNVFNQNKQIPNFNIYSPDFSKLQKTFFSYYEHRIAAGGVVLNKNNELLMIYKRDKWDLPKGHKDKGEHIKKTAIREVAEECGIHKNKLKVVTKFLKTNHIYSIKSKEILKSTYWYLIKYQGNNDILKPELNEGITKATWMPLNKIEKIHKHSYLSLSPIFKKIKKLIG